MKVIICDYCNEETSLKLQILRVRIIIDNNDNRPAHNVFIKDLCTSCYQELAKKIDGFIAQTLRDTK